jgi:hypothetical protein
MLKSTALSLKVLEISASRKTLGSFAQQGFDLFLG